MAYKGHSQSFFQRFPLLFFLGMLICFIIFPAGLINFGLDQLLRTREENSREELNAKMENALKSIATFSDNEFFSHFLLLRTYNLADATDDPIKTLKVLKGKLQKRYPNSFEFIVWDKKGRTIKNLSDENSYKYILKKTYEFLKKASKFYQPDSKERAVLTLKTLAEFEKDLNILRNFLGKLLVSHQLQYPWLSGKYGKPLQTDPPGKRSRIWYRVGKHFGILCFINSDFIKSRAGADYAIAKVKRDFPGFNANISNYPNSEEFYPPVDERISPRLILALSKFENLNPARSEKMGDLIVSCNMINQMQRAVCYGPADREFSADNAKLIYIAKTAKFLFLSLFLLSIWYKTRRVEFVSIKYKLIVLFLYAGGMPMLIMGTIGSEYLEQKKQQLIYQAQNQGINVLRNLDENFQVYLNDRAAYLSSFIQSLNRKYHLKILEPEPLNIIRKELLARLKPESIQVFSEKGQNLIADSIYTIFSDYTLPAQISIGTLKILNTTDNSKMVKDQLAEPVAEIASSEKKQIAYVGLGAHELYRYFDFLGEPENHKNVAMLHLYWRLEKLQKHFFEQDQKKWAKTRLHKGTLIKAYYPLEDAIFPASSANKDALKSIGQQTFESPILRKKSFEVGSINYTAVAMKGFNLSKIALIYLKPLQEIDNEILSLQKKLLGFSMLILSMTLLMFKFFTNHFLTPITEIKNAIESIGKRDFSFRLAIDAQNEFGELAASFNTTLEALKELETAKIVQENLLPELAINVGKVALLSYSKPFSKIGGDYFDYLLPDQQSLGVFIGDVSGHGISAALVMAMAKAAMICERNNFTNHEKLMGAINHIICLNRKAGNKEYMTGLLVFINSETGSISLINAGHCMPFVVSADGKELRQIRCGGLPLGYDPGRIFKKLDLQLKAGETLILYTDGFAETRNSSGIPLGYEDYCNMARASWNHDLSAFQKNLLQLHEQWSVAQEDDQTFILIRFD